MYYLADLLTFATTLALALSSEQPSRDKFPFGVGERLEYEVAFGPLRVGRGSMEVVGIEELRGHQTFHTVFTVKGGTFFYKVDDRLESWLDTTTLASLRFRQKIREGNRRRERNFEIYPDRGVFVENDQPEQPTVENPLDDASFLYFVRTVPLEIGQTYTFERYFRPDRNPVTIKVLRQETIRVPAGTFETLVIQPIIKARGIFSEKGEAYIWLSNDDRRIMVQMKSKLSFGSLNLYLTSHRPPTAAAAAAPPTP
ncbi:MAG: DUF3108 domain-containing protein [Gemmatimonadaceae bacterium]